MSIEGMRLRNLIVSLFLLCVIAEPLFAAPRPQVTQQKEQTAAQRKRELAQRKRELAQRKRELAQRKREAAKRKAEKKRAAQKAVAARETEKKRMAAKRQRIKEGKLMLYVYSYNQKTGEPLPATQIQVQELYARPGKLPAINKPTDNKHSRVAKTLKEGMYKVYAAKTGYFKGDTIHFNHREDEDTIKISLYPETRLTFTVTDSLTSRPIVANVIVRDQNHRKVMQTTSDSLHAILAVLLDDRHPFYTIEATALNYHSFFDTITDPTYYRGVVMMPKAVKVFVLRDIYFAMGKTEILPTSDEALNELFTLLTERPDQRIRIIGHTDDIGSDHSNQRLSEGRSEAIRRVMIQRGIDGSRIETKGRGERDPIVPNDSEEHRQKNRRVEIVLL
ncbi:MAG: OmpA family protein [Paludibacteraceae bacterium]|nr:OmpA family protein [Paludibacteraceae bacterium]